MHRCKDEAEVGRKTQDAGLKEEKTQEKGRKAQDARKKRKDKLKIRPAQKWDGFFYDAIHREEDTKPGIHEANVNFLINVILNNEDLLNWTWNKMSYLKSCCIMSNFEKLTVWHKAIDLAVLIYKMTEEKNSFKKDLGLKDQIRRASVSIPSNIAEGDELGSDKNASRQFYIAKGSSAELYTQVLISNKIGYITDDEKNHLINECKAISGMLTNLIRSRNN